MKPLLILYLPFFYVSFVITGCLIFPFQTAYTIYFCSETHYEKCLKKISRFVVEQNSQVWTKRGLLLTDPIERGLRVIEITILTE